MGTSVVPEMSVTPHHDQTSIPSPKFVIPVRYVAAGAIVQTTSTALNPEAIHIRSLRPPRTGLVIGLKLYFPTRGDVLTRTGLVAETTTGADPGFGIFARRHALARLSSVTSLGADPEIGSIYLPKGPLDATLVRRLTRAGYPNHRRER
jgi:hypothetical protein